MAREGLEAVDSSVRSTKYALRGQAGEAKTRAFERLRKESHKVEVPGGENCSYKKGRRTK